MHTSLGQIRLERADRVQLGAAVEERELRDLEWMLRGELADPLRARGVARLLEVPADTDPGRLLQLLLDEVRLGRVLVVRPDGPLQVESEVVAPTAKTLAPFSISDD
jgi:hypothetical protein